jgi:hypothetical protein
MGKNRSDDHIVGLSFFYAIFQFSIIPTFHRSFYPFFLFGGGTNAIDGRV